MSKPPPPVKLNVDFSGVYSYWYHGNVTPLQRQVLQLSEAKRMLLCRIVSSMYRASALTSQYSLPLPAYILSRSTMYKIMFMIKIIASFPGFPHAHFNIRVAYDL